MSTSSLPNILNFRYNWFCKPELKDAALCNRSYIILISFSLTIALLKVYPNQHQLLRKNKCRSNSRYHNVQARQVIAFA